MSDSDRTRRSVLRAAGLAAVGGATGLAGCSSGSQQSADDDTPTEQSSPTPEATETDAGSGSSASFGGWFDSTDNFDGVVDETGSSEVTVEVGAEANGGYFGFGPAAVRVSSGTTVTWEWTGQGSSHNVVAEDGSFESELVGEEGHTFTHTFEESGTTKYACTPHKAMGMKGVVVVE